MKMLMRSAEDDFDALLTAEAMESVGADVFSITFNREATHHGAQIPHSRFIVWAKVESDDMIERADDAITSAIDGNTAA